MSHAAIEAKPVRKPSARTADGPVLISGAAGFIGSRLAIACARAGRKVLGVDNFDDFYAPELKRANLDEVRRSAGDRFAFETLDILDEEGLARLFERAKPRTVFHFAAKAGVRPSVDDPALYMRVNAAGAANVLQAATASGCERVVVASSSSVYGDDTPAPFAETAPCAAPISPYAASKRACELLCHAHHHLHGTKIACLRLFTVYGPRQRPDLAISRFMRRIALGEPLPVFGDGSTMRDYTYVDDIVRGVLRAAETIEKHGFRVWNLGGERPIRLDALIEAIAAVVGKPALLDRRPPRPGDVRQTSANLNRARRELGFTPQTDLAEGLARQWASMRGDTAALSAA